MNMREIFLIRKEALKLGPTYDIFTILKSSGYDIELEVIKEMKGFVLGELINFECGSKISNFITEYKLSVFQPRVFIKERMFDLSSFITMEDYRNRKLEDILL